jgi:hypothetical protein
VRESRLRHFAEGVLREMRVLAFISRAVSAISDIPGVEFLQTSVVAIIRRIGLAIALIVAWAWALLAGVGGLILLLHEGPWPITNGWFAMFSGMAACPFSGWLLKKYTNIKVPLGAQLTIGLLIMIAGRIAVVLVLHRPFLPQCSHDCW